MKHVRNGIVFGSLCAIRWQDGLLYQIAWLVAFNESCHCCYDWVSRWMHLLCTITYRHTPITEFLLFSYRYSCLVSYSSTCLSNSMNAFLLINMQLIKSQVTFIMALSCIVHVGLLKWCTTNVQEADNVINKTIGSKQCHECAGQIYHQELLEQRLSVLLTVYTSIVCYLSICLLDSPIMLHLSGILPHNHLV